MEKQRVQFVGGFTLGSLAAKLILEESWKVFKLMRDVIAKKAELKELTAFSKYNRKLMVTLEGWVKSHNV